MSAKRRWLATLALAAGAWIQTAGAADDLALMEAFSKELAPPAEEEDEPALIACSILSDLRSWGGVSNGPAPRHPENEPGKDAAWGWTYNPDTLAIERLPGKDIPLSATVSIPPGGITRIWLRHEADATQARPFRLKIGGPDHPREHLFGARPLTLQSAQDQEESLSLRFEDRAIRETYLGGTCWVWEYWDVDLKEGECLLELFPGEGTARFSHLFLCPSKTFIPSLNPEDKHSLMAIYDRIRMRTQAADGEIARSEKEKQVPIPGPGGNPDKVAQVKAGALREARADWWGFEPNDATPYLQAAIDSGAARLVIPNMGKPWIVHPIVLASEQEITLEPGTVVEAIRGGFKGRTDCLFAARDRTNIVLRGDGATWRMHKSDYQDTNRYEKAEWRHTLLLQGCKNVQVRGLLLQSSGGDGVYISKSHASRLDCRDIVIKDCVIDDHHRQGISVISATNLLIENCVIKNTRGTPPGAGIDFEGAPFCGVAVRNCVFENNVHGVIIQTHVGTNSPPMSFAFENCRAVSNGSGFSASFGSGLPPMELLTCSMTNCVEISARGKMKVLNDFWRDLMGRRPLDPRQAELAARIKKMDVAGMKLKPALKPDLQRRHPAPPPKATNPFLRGKSDYILYAREGEDVFFKASYMGIGDPDERSRGMPVRIRTPSGGEVPLESNRVGKKEEFSFVARETGAYMISCDPGDSLGQVISVVPPPDVLGDRPERHPVAMLALDGPIHFFGRGGLFYFYMPAGVTECYIQAAGSGGERVKAGLYDPAGKLVEEQDNISLAHPFVISRQDASRGEVWSLKTGPPSDYYFEDYTVDLFGVPPVLATEKDALLTP